MSSVPAKLVAEFPIEPGEFVWRPTNEDPSRITFACPCGCGAIAGANVKAEVQLGVVKQPWGWNGDCEKPTLTPSIRIIGGCNWHGHLIDGVFQSC